MVDFNKRLQEQRYPSLTADLNKKLQEQRIRDAAPDLLKACQVVSNFLDRLEESADEDEVDPRIRAAMRSPLLAEIRRKVHAPLRAVLDTAIEKATGVKRVSS